MVQGSGESIVWVPLSDFSEPPQNRWPADLPLVRIQLPVWESARVQVGRSAKALLIEIQDGAEIAAREWLSQSGLHTLSIGKVALYRGQSKLLLWDLINEGWVEFVAQDWDEVEFSLRAAQKVTVERRAELLKARRGRARNLELEELHRQKGLMLADAMQREEAFRHDSDRRRTQMRDLLRLSQELAVVQTFSELVGAIRRVTRAFHGVTEVLLACGQMGQGARIVHSKGSQILERWAHHPWDGSNRIRKNEPNDSQYLANELGRPVARVLAMPLLTRKMDPSRLVPTIFLSTR